MSEKLEVLEESSPLQEFHQYKAFDRDELAIYLRTSKRYVEELDARRTGPPRIKLGGKWRYPKDGVDKWLEASIEHQCNAAENSTM